MTIENEKLEKLILDTENYHKAAKIRSYLKALEKKINSSNEPNISEQQEYLKWAYTKVDEIDPLNHN